MMTPDILHDDASRHGLRGSRNGAVGGAMHASPAAHAMARAKVHDALDVDLTLRDSRHHAQRWYEIERAMNHARDLRSRHSAVLLAAGVRYLWRSVTARRIFAPRRAKAAICALIFAGSTALAGFALSSRTASAQEKIAVATRSSGAHAASDHARLAELGISAGTIEQCEDAALLWRAVRELVLPERVSEPMQQRILRRVWILDPDIANGSVLNSENH